MQINQESSVKQGKEIHIHASPEKVWSVLTDINNWTKWNEKVTKSYIEGKPNVGKKFLWKINGVKIKSFLHTVDHMKAFGWTGKTLGSSAIHNWYLESRDGGTLVKVEESMQGWLIELFKNKMNKELEKDIKFWLEKLKAESEK